MVLLVRNLRAAAALVFLLLTSGCTNLIFQPTRVSYSDPAAQGIAVEDLWIEGSDAVTLHGWFLPAPGKVRGSVLFLHGNGENISSHVGSVYWLPAYGYEVYLVDYRGYGRSTGRADIDGVIRDAARMIDYARNRAADGGRTLTVLGHSMGGSIATCALAALPDRHGVNALISVDAFADYRQVTRDALSRHWLTRLLRWPLSLTVSNRYRPADCIGRLAPLPVYILHSEDDEIIPVRHAQILYESAAEPRFRYRLRGTHNQVLALDTNRRLLLGILDGLAAPR